MKVDVDPQTLAAIIALHEYAYQLLRWIDDRGRREPGVLADAAEALQDRERCTAWLLDRWAELPDEGRPEPQQAPAVAGLLSSFFSVSFRIDIDRSLDGALIAARIVHRPTGQRRQRGLRRKEIEALQRLAIDAGHRPAPEALRRWREVVDDADLELWMYAIELVLRSEGRTQGLDAMVSWRRMDPSAREALPTAIETARARLLAARPA